MIWFDADWVSVDKMVQTTDLAFWSSVVQQQDGTFSFLQPHSYWEHCSQTRMTYYHVIVRSILHYMITQKLFFLCWMQYNFIERVGKKYLVRTTFVWDFFLEFLLSGAFFGCLTVKSFVRMLFLQWKCSYKAIFLYNFSNFWSSMFSFLASYTTTPFSPFFTRTFCI